MNNTTQRMTLEQGRAAFAYECAVAGEKLDKKKEYKSYVRKLPMLIKTNGLGAAIAFALAKGSKEGKPDDLRNAWGLLYVQIEKWLREDQKGLLDLQKIGLMEALAQAESSVYRAVTVEVLALLSWIKRFAEALIDGEPQDSI